MSAAFAWQTYILLMSATALVTILAGRSTAIGFAAVALIQIWALGEAAVMFLDTSAPLGWYILIDTVAAVGFFATRNPGAHLFAGTFLFQLGLHIYYALTPTIDPLGYWWAHAITAYAQLAVLLGWLVAERCALRYAR